MGKVIAINRHSAFVLTLALIALVPVAKAEDNAEQKADVDSMSSSNTGDTGDTSALERGGNDADETKDWQFELSNYLWASSIKSTVSLGDVESEVDAGFGDILDLLKFGAMMHGEARRGRLGFFADVGYIKLGAATEKRVGERLKSVNIDVKADFEQTIIELGAFYRFGQEKYTFDALAGGRYTYMGTDVEVGPFGKSASVDWVDPFVGGRFGAKLSDKWTFTARGDVGGFGVGSDLTWSATALFRRRLSEHTELGIGYRHMDVDKEDGDRSFEAVTSGPVIGLGFRF